MNRLITLVPVFTGMLLGTAFASDVLPGGSKIIAGADSAYKLNLAHTFIGEIKLT